MSKARKEHDVIIIGGGPAGLSAGIYTSRDRFKTLLLERGIIGGQIVNAEEVDNYPGYPDGISGDELTKRMHRQATKYGLETINADVTALELQGKKKLVKTSQGEFLAKALIVAGGSDRQKLGIPGEAQFVGKGVSFCATCDAAFFPEKVVVVVGGGNAALVEALQVSKFARKVYVIHRRDELRATKVVQEKAFAEKKMAFIWDTVVDEIAGGDFVQNLKLRNVKTGKKSTLAVDGVFIAVGLQPNTGYLKGVLPLDERGSVMTNERMETEVPGVFAAGDIRHNSGWQTITAAGDGAMAAMSAGRYLAE